VRVARAEQAEEELLRKFELDSARFAQRQSTSEERKIALAALERVREAEEARASQEVERRSKLKEINSKKREIALKKRDNAAKEVREQSRREAEEMATARSDEYAYERRRKLESVLNAVKADLAKAEDKLEEETSRLALLPPSPRHSAVGSKQEVGATSARRVHKLQERLDSARRMEERVQAQLDEFVASKSKRAAA